VNGERVDLPAVHSATPLVISSHSDIETVLGILKEGRPALVSIETGGALRDWTQMADTLAGLVVASGHHIALVSDSRPVGSRRWRKSTRALARLRVLLVFPSELAEPSIRLSYAPDGNAQYLEVTSPPIRLRRLTD
jgi:hypothetical protein